MVELFIASIIFIAVLSIWAGIGQKIIDYMESSYTIPFNRVKVHDIWRWNPLWFVGLFIAMRKRNRQNEGLLNQMTPGTNEKMELKE